MGEKKKLYSSPLVIVMKSPGSYLNTKMRQVLEPDLEFKKKNNKIVQKTEVQLFCRKLLVHLGSDLIYSTYITK